MPRDALLVRKVLVENQDEHTPWLRYTGRRNVAQRRAIERWKSNMSPSEGAPKSTSFADFENYDDEISVAFRLYGEAMASAVAVFLEKRDRVGLMLKPFMVLKEEVAKTIVVLEDSVARLQGLTCGLDIANDRTRAGIDKREALLAVLREDEHKFWLAREKFISDSHVYRKLVRYLLVDRLRLTATTQAIHTRMLVLHLKAQYVLSGAKDLRKTFQSLQKHSDYPRSQAHANLFDRLQSGILQHRIDMMLVSECINRISDTLKTISMLEGDMDGLTHAHVDAIMTTFSTTVRGFIQIKAWAYTRSPLLPSSPQYPNRTAKALATIDELTSALLIDSITSIQEDLRAFREHLFARTKSRLEEPSISSSLADGVRKMVVHRILDAYKADRHTPRLKRLRQWGYKPSTPPIETYLETQIVQRHSPIPEGSVRRVQSEQRVQSMQSVRIRYLYMKTTQEANLKRFRIRKIPERANPRESRHHVRSKRKQALEKIRKMLASTLSSFNEQLPTWNNVSKWAFRKILYPTSVEKRKAIARGSRSSGRLHAARNAYSRVPARNKQRHLDYAFGVAGVQTNRDGPSVSLSGFCIPSKSSTLGKTCSILGFGGARNPTNRTPPGGVVRKTFAGQNKTRPKTNSTRPTKTVGALTRRGAFNPPPQLRAPHSMSFFTESTVSERIPVSPGNGVNENANGAGYGNDSNQGADAPNINPPVQQNPPPPSSISKESSDSDRPSDSDHESESESEPEPDSDMEDAEEKHVHTPLTYQIPPDTLLAAMQASPNTRASYWSQLLYRGPNDEKVSIHYCRDMDVAERVAKYFLEEKVLGFDMEWKAYAWPTSIKHNASLIQLACEDRIALFHIALFVGKTAAELVPPSLKIILESPDIYKVGVNIKGDFTRLQKHLGIQARGVLELSRIHNLVERPEAGLRLCSLSKQVQQHLLLPLYKGEDLADETKPDVEEATTEDNVDNKGKTRTKASVRESDWSRKLDHGQIHYAAADAYAGFRLYDVLESKRKKMKPVPPLPRLCDDDPIAKPKPEGFSRKPKATKKSKVDTVIVPNGEDSEDAQEYQTALEEIEEDDGEEADSESSSEGSHSSAKDSDAEYFPKCRQQFMENNGQGVATSSRAATRRIGRINLSRPTDAEPNYRTLPTSSSKEESELDESDAFDPVPAARPRRAIQDKPVVDQTLGYHEDEEFADSELEDALMDMDIDPLSDESTPENTKAIVEEEEAANQEFLAVADVTNDDTQPDAMDLDTSGPQQASNTIPTFSPLIPAPDNTLHTPAFNTATSWAQSYLKNTVPSLSSSSFRPAGIRATTPHLRAYYLWHHMRIPLEDIGAHMRDPPLAQSTVSSYILQAVSLEKLECENERLRAVLGTLPQGMREGRWKWLEKRVRSIR